ncbi:MipA/OmpV family protein [Thiothrix litoralis]|uniref:MipA/OmpV family protein n=1 Tax=Thiothrix litoralis TaxID=2891210 RepID=A0ABX7WP30_9GAMM|nr:MipA/OmpV family protein [Thiothrix litoralis]QTR45581.1 MipA/OmpV family protein [Thiothrix litoralis]
MKYTLCAAMALLATLPAHADDSATAGWNVGLAATVSQSPFVDGDAALSGKPVMLGNNEFDIAGPTLSLSATPQREFYIGAGLDDWDYERGDSPTLQDMKSLDRAINLRVGGAWKLASGSATVDLAQDVAGAHKGAQVKARYTQRLAGSYAAVRPYMEAQWLSADMTDYYVGVDADEVKAGRPAYQADAALALKAGVLLEQPISKRLTLVGEANVTGYDSAISDSPIIDNSTIWGGAMGVAYRW